LFKNGWEPKEAEVIGEEQRDRTRTGLWPSDHAGVFGGLELEDHREHHHYKCRNGRFEVYSSSYEDRKHNKGNCPGKCK